MVRQVKVVAILMIVQGVLASLMGLLFLGLGVTIVAAITMDKQPHKSPEDDTMLTVVTAYYVIVGAPTFIAGILNVMSGIRCLKFRSRTMAVVALFANIPALLTCYCVPTALGVMIYGLIVMFHKDVAAAFMMAEQGQSPEEILGSFP